MTTQTPAGAYAPAPAGPHPLDEEINQLRDRLLTVRALLEDGPGEELTPERRARIRAVLDGADPAATHGCAPTCVTFTVHALHNPNPRGRTKPVGQGAIRHNAYGSGYHANGDLLKPWRSAVQAAAAAATGRHAYITYPKPTKKQRGLGVQAPPKICLRCRVPGKEHGLFLGPVRLLTVVTFARPKTDPSRPYPTGRDLGDWDHHGRSVSDALTGVLYPDDAQIIDGHVIKTYPGGHPDALDRPGAVIHCWEAT